MIEYINSLRDIHQDDENLRLLNEIENALTEKKYGLVWEEHSEKVDEMLEHNISIFMENKDKKIVADENEHYNFLLEGDNLHSLKLLEKTHKGKIDVIYIDPPYNTGNKDFVYNDRYVENDDGYKHSKWLSFMNERLKIAKNLLSADGIIFISIDDNEQAQLKLLCDEIFGEDNFLAQLSIKTGDVYGTKAAHIDKTFVKVKDYVIIYDLSEKKKQPLYDSLMDLYDLHYTHVLKDNNNIIGIIDYLKEDKFSSEEFEKYRLSIAKQNINKLILVSDKFKEYFIKNISEILYKDSQYNQKIPDEVKNKLELKKAFEYNGKLLMKTNGKTIRHLQAFKDVLRYSDDNTPVLWRSIPRGNLWDGFAKDMGNVGKEGGVSLLNGKKPIRLIKQLLKWMNISNSTVLDFFAGSGTTGHAVVQLNKEDGGNRKYILCTNNENNICEEVTYQRLKNIQEELPHNLKYFKTDFIPKLQDEENNIRGKMLDHIEPLIELEYHTELDGINNIIAFDEEEIKETLENAKDGINVFINSEIILSNEEKKIASEKGIDIIEIPEYYFRNELKEVGEL